MSDDIYQDPTSSKTSDSDIDFGSGKLGKGTDTEIARHAVAIWQAKNDIYSKRLAQWEVNEMRRAGVKNVSIKKEGNRTWIAWVPPNVGSNPDVVQAMNKAATLARKLVSIMYADPPAPKSVPAGGEDEDRDAAEFTERMLTDLMGPEKLNDIALHIRAFDKSSTFASAYIYYSVDPTAGGKVPIQVSAGVDSTTGRSATNIDDLIKDPETGENWPDFVERYITEEGTLSTEVGEAKTRFVPGLRGEVLTGRNVRMIPHDAMDISAARGVQIAMFPTWGTLKSLYPKLKEMSEEERDKLFEFLPERGRRIMSRDERRHWEEGSKDRDEQPVFTLITYYKSGPEYPDGLVLVTVGDEFKAEQDTWCMEDQDGRTICLPLPLCQHKQWSEGSDVPEGHALMELVGNANEIRTNLVTQLAENVDRINNRLIFVPMGSNLQAKHFRLPGRSIIKITPGGEPKYEDVPSYPRDGYNLWTVMGDEMENAVSLSDVAQGLESSQVQSGRHAQAIIAQSHAALSEIRQNTISAHVRAWHVQTMLVRAFFDSEQRIGWVGEDGAYKERHWTNADLRNTSDTVLKPGTLSMISPVAKSQMAEHLLMTGAITQDEFQERIADALGPILGMRDNPFLLRIRRQIAHWDDGPPESWQPQIQSFPDPQTGQEISQQVMDPVLQGIFRPLSGDDKPHIALLRLRELCKAQARSLYATLPAEWQWGLDQELARAGLASSGTQGQQPGQQPAQEVSPAQRTQGPQALPQIPLPSDAPATEGIQA